nr:unnamed protein product [Callosobruchus chinensis]
MIQDSLSIDKKSGVVTVKIDNAFDYDKVNPVIFQVKAEDNAIPPHTATVPVTITLLDVNNKKPIINTVPFYIIDTNDNAPTFKLDEEIHIDEESDKNKEVKAINPEDKDRDG